MQTKLKKTMIIVTALLAGAICMPASGSGWSGRQVTKTLNFLADRKIVIQGFSGDWDNPDACESATKIVLDPESSQVGYDEMYAILLGAHLTGREIQFYLSGCVSIGSQMVPVIKTVKIY